jgi:hypothetical protein
MTEKYVESDERWFSVKKNFSLNSHTAKKINGRVFKDLMVRRK